MLAWYRDLRVTELQVHYTAPLRGWLSSAPAAVATATLTAAALAPAPVAAAALAAPAAATTAGNATVGSHR